MIRSIVLNANQICQILTTIYLQRYIYSDFQIGLRAWNFDLNCPFVIKRWLGVILICGNTRCIFNLISATYPLVNLERNIKIFSQKRFLAYHVASFLPTAWMRIPWIKVCTLGNLRSKRDICSLLWSCIRNYLIKPDNVSG